MKRDEKEFQDNLIKEIESRFDGSIVFKNDPEYIQGIPDLLVVYKDRWAALECKKNATASHRPNQDYYVNKMDGMSFASFIYPENKEEVLHEMERSFGIRG